MATMTAAQQQLAAQTDAWETGARIGQMPVAILL